MSKYTPGPWTAHAPSEDLETRHWTIRAPGISPMVSFEVARISGRSATDPHTASLIAAAPELLASLIEITGVLDVLLMVKSEPENGSIGGRARAAIAKATGGAA